MKKNLLVSACLLGLPCRYDGQCHPFAGMAALLEKYVPIPVCPEVLGGLPTPRIPAERQGDRVITRDGRDVTDAYCRGAEETLRIAHLSDCEAALLKERSPSCGSGTIYDGTFTHTSIPGDGVTVELLKKSGVAVFGESEYEKLL